MKYKKDYTKVQALMDFGNKVNAMTLAFAAILRLYVYFANIKAQKIDISKLLAYSMMITNF